MLFLMQRIPYGRVTAKFLEDKKNKKTGKMEPNALLKAKRELIFAPFIGLKNRWKAMWKNPNRATIGEFFSSLIMLKVLQDYFYKTREIRSLVQQLQVCLEEDLKRDPALKATIKKMAEKGIYFSANRRGEPILLSRGRILEIGITPMANETAKNLGIGKFRIPVKELLVKSVPEYVAATEGKTAVTFGRLGNALKIFNPKTGQEEVIDMLKQFKGAQIIPLGNAHRVIIQLKSGATRSFIVPEKEIPQRVKWWLNIEPMP
jgi:hypothetical protein